MPLECENVELYPRPPALQPVPHRLRVLLAGASVADTRAGFRVCETYHAPTYYFPPGDVVAQLSPAAGASFCEWKGQARYWDVTAGEQTVRRAAWSYEAPTARFRALAGYVAFYAGLMQACFVGKAQVIPQPGDFYGGWITANLTGRIKGAPGTRHW